MDRYEEYAWRLNRMRRALKAMVERFHGQVETPSGEEPEYNIVLVIGDHACRLDWCAATANELEAFLKELIKEVME